MGELRDGIVLKLLRFLQGQSYGYIRTKAYQIKYDQRELMKVIQRNFRKFASLKYWGWFIIIQKTRPLIGQINLEQELAILEEKANASYGLYMDALNVTKELEADCKVLKTEEIPALTKQPESEQGNLSVYTDRQARAALGGDRKAMEGEIVGVKKDIEDLELAVQKVDQESTNRDHVIKTLYDETVNQDEVINKLNKEKKMIGENQAKAMEDLQAANEKASHLSGIKGKLESTLGELENGGSNEKRARADAEKVKRKTEGELKMAQETVNELEASKRELENVIARKEKDLSGLGAKLEDEQSHVAKLQKAI